MLDNPHVTIQADGGGKKYKHAKNKTKRKATRGRSDTSRAAAAFKAGRTRAFLSSSHYAGRADRRGVGGGGWWVRGGGLRPAGELQIHLHLSALGGCPQKLLASVLTLMGANERRRHVFSSSSFFPLYQRLLRTGWKYRFFTQLRSFTTRGTDAAQSPAMTTNSTRRFL